MPRKAMTVPRPLLDIQTFDEANVGQLGLISLHERIGSDFTQWTKTLEINGQSAELSCKSTEDVGGVPHGIDGDVAAVLGILYLKQQAPLDGFVHTTAYELLTLAGFPDNAAYYTRIEKSLERLSVSRFRILRAWKRPDPQRGAGKDSGYLYDSTQFALIAQINRTSLLKEGLGRGTSLHIKLADPVAENLRQRHVYPLDLEFVASLSRSQARGLYRLLSAVRLRDPLNPLSAFSVRVLEWADTCKIRETYPTKVRRALEDAHHELIERGFLSEVRFEGRGAQARFHYVFASSPQGLSAPLSSSTGEGPFADPELVVRMARHGVKGGAAQKLLVQFGAERVALRIQKFEHLLSQGYTPKSRSGLLVDVVRDESGKYPDAAPSPGSQRPTRPQVLPPSESKEPFAGLEPAEAGARLVASLKVLCRNRLSEGTLRLLRHQVEAGEVSAAELSAQAARAAAALDLENFVTQLEARFTPQTIG